MNFFRRLLNGPRVVRRRAATAVGLEAGLLEECPVCREIVDSQRQDRLAAADAVAADWIERGDPRVRLFHGDVSALRKSLREAQDRYDVSCTCEGR